MGGDKRISTALKIITVGLLALLVAPILFLLSSAASKTGVAHSAVINRSSYSRHNITTRTRSDHGYIRPHPPFPSLQRTSHTCRIIITNNNTEEEEIVHI